MKDVKATKPASELGNGPAGVVGSKKDVGPGAEVAPAAKTKAYAAGIHPGPATPLPDELVEAVKSLEKALGMPVWLLRQTGAPSFEGIAGTFDALTDTIAEACIDRCNELPQTPIALLIDSPGGQADVAYRLARLLHRRCGSYVALVPRYAKSAATLLCLGADQIIVGDYAELGPIDVQLLEPDREGWASGLDEVQALEQLTRRSLESLDQVMILLLARTRKRTMTVLPDVMHYVAELYRPMIEKIDTVHFTSTARLLQVAQDYSQRLLAKNMPAERAAEIANTLIEKYSSHEFLIDRDEAAALGLPVVPPSEEVAVIFARLMPILRQSPTYIGPLVEVKA